MLIPSYAELMDILNKETSDADEITSRYTIVIAVAKRARQLVDGDEPMIKGKKGKPVSIAVEELFQSKIKVVPEGEGTVVVLRKSTIEFDLDGDLSKNILDSTTVESFKSRENISEVSEDEEKN